jgi:hypothetical protein
MLGESKTSVSFWDFGETKACFPELYVPCKHGMMPPRDVACLAHLWENITIIRDRQIGTQSRNYLLRSVMLIFERTTILVVINTIKQPNGQYCHMQREALIPNPLVTTQIFP